MPAACNEKQHESGQLPTYGSNRPDFQKGTRRKREPGKSHIDDRVAKLHKAFSEGVKRPMIITLGDEPQVFKKPTLLGPVVYRKFYGDGASASASLLDR